jgi:hypothetical protein
MNDYQLLVLKQLSGDTQGLCNEPQLHKAIKFLQDNEFVKGRNCMYTTEKGREYLANERT